MTGKQVYEWLGIFALESAILCLVDVLGGEFTIGPTVMRLLLSLHYAHYRSRMEFNSVKSSSTKHWWKLMTYDHSKALSCSFFVRNKARLVWSSTLAQWISLSRKRVPQWMMANTMLCALPEMVVMPHFKWTAGQWMSTTLQVNV